MVTDPGTEPALRSSGGTNAQLENARAGYQAAISLMTFEGNLIWTRYGLMILVHTIILTAIGLTSGTAQPARTVTLVGLSVVGLVLCAVWWLVNEIGFRYYFYWLFSARELEEQYLSPARTLSRGIPLTPGELVTVVLDGKEHRLAVRSRDRFNVIRASNLVIAIVGLLYLVFLTVLLLA